MASKSKRRSTALSDQWMDFADKTFDADEYAEGFFLTHPESEAEERCAELMNLRYQTQDLLRQKVSSHYQMFMRGTEDIQHVESDIAHMRRLVAKMQDSLKQLDIASCAILDCPGGANAQRNRGPSVSFEPTKAAARAHAPPQPQSDASFSKLPKWLQTAPEDLERLMIEKQRPAAVALIEKARGVFAQGGMPSHNDAAQSDLLLQVNRRADMIADRIIRDLDEMSRTILYDFGDMSRQLRMLIILGKAETAVAFFIRNRGGIIERSLRLIEAGGDTLSYVTLLSERFFALLTEACAAFDSLFAEHPAVAASRPDCFARLVLWVDAEVKRYGSLVGRQLLMMRRDLVGNRPLRKDSRTQPTYDTTTSNTAASTPTSTRSHVFSPATPVTPTSTSTPSTADTASPRVTPSGASLTRSVTKSTNPEIAGVSYDESFVTMGACLEVAFTLAARLDGTGIPVRPSLASVLGRDLSLLLSGLARAVSARIDEELWNESWTAVSVPARDLALRPASALLAGVREDEGEGDGQEEGGGEQSHSSSSGGRSSSNRNMTPATTTTTTTTSSSSSSSSNKKLGTIKGEGRHNSTADTTASALKGTVSVLSIAAVLIREINHVVTSFVLLKEPADAPARYSHELTALDSLLAIEVLNLLQDFPAKLERRWGGIGSTIATGRKKRLTPQDLKERAIAADTLQSMLDVTLETLFEWFNDPLMLVDQGKAERDVGAVRDVYEACMVAWRDQRAHRDSSQPPAPSS